MSRVYFEWPDYMPKEVARKNERQQLIGAIVWWISFPIIILICAHILAVSIWGEEKVLETLARIWTGIKQWE